MSWTNRSTVQGPYIGSLYSTHWVSDSTVVYCEIAAVYYCNVWRRIFLSSGDDARTGCNAPNSGSEMTFRSIVDGYILITSLNSRYIFDREKRLCLLYFVQWVSASFLSFKPSNFAKLHPAASEALLILFSLIVWTDQGNVGDLFFVEVFDLPLYFYQS